MRPVFTTNENVQHTQWPMVNLRAKEVERAAQMFKRQKAELFEGNDDVFFDAKEYHSMNKNVANILTGGEQAQSKSAVLEKAVEKVQEATLENLDDAWGDEEDKIDIEVAEDITTATDDKSRATGDEFIDGDNLDSDIFVPPSAGADPLKQALKKNPMSVGLHVASGEFAKAFELLRKQLGINRFEGFK